MFELIKTGTKFDFIGKSRIYFTVSLVLCFLGLVLIFAKGFNYGVDFSGGTSVQVTFEKPVDIDKMRTTLSQDVGASVSIQTLGSDNSFRIKVDQGSGDENLKKISDTISNTLKAKFSEGGNVTIDSVEQVGPQVGKDLKRQALLAVLYAVIGILIYVAIRFELMSATSSIIALIHDIILTLGVVIALNVTFDLTVLAALLTVVGYSLNDKIVIFDRIRERARMDEHIPLMESMNISINETLSRTILTSTSTLLAVISLAIFGGEVIKGFAIVMIAGIIIGTYSSIGIASSLVYAIKTRKGKK
ncbi:MAG: protein translocase subunit SecF [Mucispirillum sp.]|uniref:Protein-export membrane protein SecF n=1 Tax=Candidatus Mucispirillum faecigallinarum TaxID=2838699 RepID=A0A9D2GVE7_9BACT|nr:protein translocase subunit SecF [Mucispirillum sp.]HIZ90104.1 protein translocase subunit SecF [Candidatus Mucispirillum faecigallinarum]